MPQDSLCSHEFSCQKMLLSFYSVTHQIATSLKCFTKLCKEGYMYITLLIRKKENASTSVKSEVSKREFKAPHLSSLKVSDHK